MDPIYATLSVTAILCLNFYFLALYGHFEVSTIIIFILDVCSSLVKLYGGLSCHADLQPLEL